MDLYDQRRRLAKRANQRLRRLEGAVSDITGKSFTYGAYDVAVQWLASDKPRFSESMQKGKTEKEIIDEIHVLEKFLYESVSTVQGMRKVESKRVKSLVKNGISESTARDSDFYEFLNSSSYETLLKSYTSTLLMEIYDSARKEGKIPEDIEKAFRKVAESKQAQEGNATFKTIIKEINAIEIPNSKNI